MTHIPSTGLVTAGCGTIGRAVAAAILARGLVDRLVVVDVVDPGDHRLPEGSVFRRADLRDPDQVAALVEELPGAMTLLVNVLGGERWPPVRPIEDPAWPPPEVWNDIVDLNVSSAYRLTRALLDRLAPGAAVCQVSSIAAIMPWAVSPAYGAAKAALEHWSGSLAVLLADRGIRVNLVRPGFVWSQQWRSVDRDEFERVARDRVPLRQVAATAATDREQTAADVAAAVAYLCSSDAAHLTGQAVNVDGGA
ncbi:MAG: SDR family oxidoreductase, partial [Dactylosporangium sp.]|nr:SDR family oxidoreductase [Dactylosporangium sp.]